ncbi:MAG: formate dehydrogenase accessory protein FdhE [Deltaproteobacteria bacterium]|nr:formate dehydrogenase accessory protein FdhE [Deltaproteobacteria bacterium]
MTTEVSQIFAQYREEFPHYLEFIETLQNIHLLRNEKAATRPRDIFTLSPVSASRKLKADQPLINLKEELLNDPTPEQYFLELLSLAENEHPSATAAIRETLAADKNAYRELIRELFARETNLGETAIARILTISTEAEELDLIPLLLHESLKPFFTELAANLNTVIRNSGWNQGRCPVCSRPADLSLLREEEGKRTLFCLQCDCEWPYKRLQCPFCGEEDQQKLSYFTVEDGNHDKYRVNVCHQCQRYIKTIDTRKSSSAINPEIENLVTLHLDLQAAKEGFK